MMRARDWHGLGVLLAAILLVPGCGGTSPVSGLARLTHSVGIARSPVSLDFKVCDAETDLPIQDASIQIQDPTAPQQTLTTDAEGHATIPAFADMRVESNVITGKPIFRNVSYPSWTIGVSAEGYEASSEPLSAYTGPAPPPGGKLQPPPLEVRLRRHAEVPAHARPDPGPRDSDPKPE